MQHKHRENIEVFILYGFKKYIISFIYAVFWHGPLEVKGTACLFPIPLAPKVVQLNKSHWVKNTNVPKHKTLINAQIRKRCKT